MKPCCPYLEASHGNLIMRQYITRHINHPQGLHGTQSGNNSLLPSKVLYYYYTTKTHAWSKRSYLPHSHSGPPPSHEQDLPGTSPPFWPEGQLGLTMHMVLFQHSLTPRLIAWLPKHAKMEIVIPFKGGLGGQKEVSDWLLKAMFPATTGKCRERQLHSFQFPPTGYIMQSSHRYLLTD